MPSHHHAEVTPDPLAQPARKGKAGGVSRGKFVLGTVKGDLHDIGKNLVVMMLEIAGDQVVDLELDVPAEILGVPALLTTTMIQMETTVGAEG